MKRQQARILRVGCSCSRVGCSDLSRVGGEPHVRVTAPVCTRGKIRDVKVPVRRRSEAEVIREFPLTGLAPWWYFRVAEVSAGVYEVEGTDLLNGRVRRTGTDPDELLNECVRDAAAIARAQRA